MLTYWKVWTVGWFVNKWDRLCDIRAVPQIAAIPMEKPSRIWPRGVSLLHLVIFAHRVFGWLWASHQNLVKPLSVLCKVGSTMVPTSRRRGEGNRRFGRQLSQHLAWHITVFKQCYWRARALAAQHRDRADSGGWVWSTGAENKCADLSPFSILSIRSEISN